MSAHLSSSIKYLPESESDSHSSDDGSPAYKQRKVDSVLKRMNKLGKKADNFAHRIKEHVRLAPKITESEKAGPIAGLLFVSTDKVAFCSERSIKCSSPNGQLFRVHYKVLIPIEKIERVYRSVNMKKPSMKYMEIHTVEGFHFWLMGFLNYEKGYKSLHQAISMSQC